MDNKKSLIILTDYYEPAFLAGGPVRSLKNIVNELKSQIDILVITRNYDLGKRTIPLNETSNKEVIYEGTRIIYTKGNFSHISILWKILKKYPNTNIYFNSFFSLWYTLLPIIVMKLTGTNNREKIIAPRGQLCPGALKLKKTKKKLFLKLASIFGFYKDFHFHFTSEQEYQSIPKKFKNKKHIVIPNLTSTSYQIKQKKTCSDHIFRLVFLSRICKIKNVDLLLTALKYVNTPITLDIYGPITENVYWPQCEQIISQLPKHITVTYKGSLPPSNVASTLSQYDLFCLLSASENFGHAIIESLSVGCPVLLSAFTPWNDVQEHEAGWICDITNLPKIATLIDKLAKLHPVEYESHKKNAFAYYRNKFKNSKYIQDYIKLLAP